MSMTLEELQSALTTVQQELSRVQQRLEELERVVTIDHDENGNRSVHVECTDFILRPAEDRKQIAVHIGSENGGGYMQVHYAGSAEPAVEIAMVNDGSPYFGMHGLDGEPRCEVFLHEDCGCMAVRSKDGRPGALMRAQTDGGSVAVLQEDGKARAVLVHGGTENPAPDSDEAAMSTNLLFADSKGNTTLKLRVDAIGSMITAGTPGQPDALSLVSRPDGPAILMHGPNDQSGISLMVMAGMSEVCVHEGKMPGNGAEASLSAGEHGSSMCLRGIGGQKSVDLSALDVASSMSLHDSQGDVKVILAHHFGSHSALTLQGMNDEEGLRAVTSADVSSLEIISPADPATKVLTAVTADKAVTIVQKENRPIVMIGEGEQGGLVCAYGPSTDQAGIASLSGGQVAGSLVLATVDGTAQMTLDATDHGGRMLINNDLGFQRIAMGVYQEAAGLHMNNTGSIGVQAVATPKGGIVTVSDSEGRAIATLPDDDEDKSDWGRLPDGF